MQDDHDDEDWHDDEDADLDGVVPCPECGADVYDDSDHCPACGHSLTDEDRHGLGDGRPSRGVRIVAIVMIVVFIVTMLLAGSMF